MSGGWPAGWEPREPRDTRGMLWVPDGPRDTFSPAIGRAMGSAQAGEALRVLLGVPGPRRPAQRRRDRLRALLRARPYVRWEETYPTDRYVGVAWGPQVSTDTWGVGLGLGRWAAVLHVPRVALWHLREPARDREARLTYLAADLVTPERYASPETLARVEEERARSEAWATARWQARVPPGLVVDPGCTCDGCRTYRAAV